MQRQFLQRQLLVFQVLADLMSFLQLSLSEILPIAAAVNEINALLQIHRKLPQMLPISIILLVSDSAKIDQISLKSSPIVRGADQPPRHERVFAIIRNL